MVEDALVQSGRAGHHGYLVLGDFFHDAIHIKDGMRIDGAACHQRGQPAGFVAEAVEERVDYQIAVVFIEAD